MRHGTDVLAQQLKQQSDYLLAASGLKQEKDREPAYFVQLDILVHLLDNCSLHRETDSLHSFFCLLEACSQMGDQRKRQYALQALPFRCFERIWESQIDFWDLWEQVLSFLLYWM